MAKASEQTDGWIFFHKLSDLLLFRCYWNRVVGPLWFVFHLVCFSGWCPPAESMHFYCDPFPRHKVHGRGCAVPWGMSVPEECLPQSSEGSTTQHSSVTQKAVLVFLAEKQWPSTPKEVFFFRVNDRGIFLLSLILLQRQSFLRNQPLSIASGCYRWGKVWGECLNYVQFWQLNLSPAI